jgi:rubrerythrin
MKSLKGTKRRRTAGGLCRESQARNRYTYFAGAARKEGFQQIALIFEETANQEKELPKVLHLPGGGGSEITAAYPRGSDHFGEPEGGGGRGLRVGTYPASPRRRKSGLQKYAVLSSSQGRETAREEEDLAKNVETGKVFKKEQKVVWRCLNCGYLHEGTEAPAQCPACVHPQGYFEVLGENW